MIPLILFVGAGALLLALRQASHQPTLTSGQATVYAGVPYRFVIRLDTSAASASNQTALHAALTAAGATNIAFVTKTSESFATFDIRPKTTDSAAIGSPLTGLGRIESITRLDGKSFGDPP